MRWKRQKGGRGRPRAEGEGGSEVGGGGGSPLTSKVGESIKVEEEVEEKVGRELPTQAQSRGKRAAGKKGELASFTERARDPFVPSLCELRASGSRSTTTTTALLLSSPFRFSLSIHYIWSVGGAGQEELLQAMALQEQEEEDDGEESEEEEDSVEESEEEESTEESDEDDDNDAD